MLVEGLQHLRPIPFQLFEMSISHLHLTATFGGEGSACSYRRK